MNIFQWLWSVLVNHPQLNLLYFFYNFTHDTGWAIVLVAVVINVSLWPMYGKMYINLQKLRLLSPDLKLLQTKYKDEPMEMMKESKLFYQKHNIDNSFTFKVLLFQIFFVSGLFFLVKDISIPNMPASGLYDIFWHQSSASFSQTAFGFIDIGASAVNYWYLSALNFIFTLGYGYYAFKLTPQIPVSTDGQTPEQIEQAAAMQKSQEFVGIYLTPFLLLALNWSVPAGLNIYFVVLAILSLARQITITKYYSTNLKAFHRDLLTSDPAADQPEKLRLENVTLETDKESEEDVEKAKSTIIVEAKAKPKNKEKKGKK